MKARLNERAGPLAGILQIFPSRERSVVSFSSPAMMVLPHGEPKDAGTVKLGRDYGATVEVADGLIDGATVVLNPNADLVDGSRVRILAAAPKPAPSGGAPK